MFIVHEFIHIKPEYIDAFKEATIQNAKHSLKEPGIARFDAIQQLDEPARFVLVKVYRTPKDPAKHRETMRFKKRVDIITGMMVEPRTRTKFTNVFPDQYGWD